MSELATPAEIEDDGPDMAAAELALGLLDGEERALAIRRVLAEPGFAREVERWRGYLAQLFDLWPAMPAPDVLARVEHSIDHPAAPLPLAAPVTPARRGRLWPALAVLSSIAAVGLLVVLLTRPVALPPAPRPVPTVVVAPSAPTLVASIAPTGEGEAVTAIYDARGGEMRLTQAKLVQTAGSAELWIIPTGGKPHSLGLLRKEGPTTLTLRSETRTLIAAGATLAVSLEPVGGSPTGAPTGPVVATGALSRV